MDIFATILAYGYIFIVGFVFLIMIIQVLAFYVAGRATGSINDEVTSAFSLFGALLIVGAASTLINAVLTTFLSGMLIPGVISFIIYLAAIIFAVVNIYELSIGKAILHLIISFVITVVAVGLLGYLGTLVLPEVDLNEAMEVETDVLGTMEIEDVMIEDELPTREELLDVDTAPVGVIEKSMEATDTLNEAVEEATPSGPGLPGSSE